MHWEKEGAFTGEISAPMLVELDASVMDGRTMKAGAGGAIS